MADDEVGRQRAAGADPAPAIALGQGPLDPRAAAYLDEQTRLARLQAENLIEQNAFELSHLRFRRLSDWGKFALEVSAGLVALLIVCGIAAMVWNASQARGLIVDAFSVPGDVANSGMTGSVLAARVLDAFGRMQSSISFSPSQGADSYRRHNGDEVRVEIPQTGISIGELDRYLRDWLGNETHVGGDLVRTPKGYALTVRYGDAPGVTAQGTELDALIVQSAEHMFAAARPLRYAEYLTQNRRFDEALAVIKPLTQSGSPSQQARAYADWASLTAAQGDNKIVLGVASAGFAIDPKNPSVLGWLSTAEFQLGREEAAHAHFAIIRGLWQGPEVADLDPGLVADQPIYFTSLMHEAEGDYLAATQDMALYLKFRGTKFNRTSSKFADDAAFDRDIALARSIGALIPEKNANGQDNVYALDARFHLAMMMQDWRGALAAGRAVEAAALRQPLRHWMLDVWIRPRLAYVMAVTGDIAGAQALTAKTPFDCDLCLRLRGRIAALRRDWVAAAYWFELVSDRSPHIPFADTDWGEMLLRKGDYAAAIAKFESATRKGPHFADPLMMWGEALIATNRSDLAVKKFEDAARCAPDWGRLHLKWGEALLWLGRRDDGAKQFALARALYLTAAERGALDRLKPRR